MNSRQRRKLAAEEYNELRDLKAEFRSLKAKCAVRAIMFREPRVFIGSNKHEIDHYKECISIMNALLAEKIK